MIDPFFLYLVCRFRYSEKVGFTNSEFLVQAFLYVDTKNIQGLIKKFDKYFETKISHKTIFA